MDVLFHQNLPCFTTPFNQRLLSDHMVKASSIFYQIEISGFELLLLKGILRDHSSDSALNFHEIQDFCIFVMVLDV